MLSVGFSTARHVTAAFVFVYIIAYITPATAQPLITVDSVAEREFQSALKAFDRGMYSDAGGQFEKVLRRPPNQRTTAAYIMAARAYRSIGRPADVVRVLRPVFVSWPASAYMPDCLLLYGGAQTDLGKFVDAGFAYMALAQLEAPDSMVSIGLVRLADLVINHSIGDSLRSLMSESGEEKVFDSILLRALRCVRETEDINSAQRLEKRVALLLHEHAAEENRTTHQPDSVRSVDTSQRSHEDEAVAVEATKQQPEVKENPAKDGEEFGVHRQEEIRKVEIMPDSIDLAVKNEDAPTACIMFFRPGPFGDEERDWIVEEVRAGVSTAVAGFMRRENRRIEVLDVPVSDADSISAAIRLLKTDRRIIGCIGGIFTDDARLVTTAMKGCKVPLLLASATGSGLTSSRRNVFQLNVPFAKRGNMLARFVVEQMQADKVLVLVSDASFAGNCADAFIEAAAALGLSVVKMVNYDGGAERIDSVMVRCLSEVPHEMHGLVLLHVSGSVREADALLHAVQSSRLPVRVLGAGDFNDQSMLAKYTDWDDTVYVETDYGVDTAEDAYHSFESLFVETREHAPSRHAVFGYDAAMLLLSCLDAQHDDSSWVAARIKKRYVGLRSLIKFSMNRQNTVITVLDYYRGAVKRRRTVSE